MLLAVRPKRSTRSAASPSFTAGAGRSMTRVSWRSARATSNACSRSEVDIGFNSTVPWRSVQATAAPLRVEPLTARGVRTRDALVQAARNVFERDGFLNAHVTALADAAAAAHGS